MKWRIRFVMACVGVVSLVSAEAVESEKVMDLETRENGSGGVHQGLRMNQMQVIGTHNSYHVRPKEPLFSQVKAVYPDAVGWDYTHAPLDVQLERGVRSFELDVYHDPAGTKVLHVPQFDTGSTCRTLVEGLETVRAWSEKNPTHVPVIILVELKDEPVSQTRVPILPFDEAALDQLDREIRSVFDSEHLLSPDDVRQDAATLSEAIRTIGWPLLDAVRGKVMLVLHARGLHAERYTDGRPSLEGRAMFLESQEGKPYASVFIRNNPHDQSIGRLVKEGGYIVRTRADSGLGQGIRGDTTRRDAALASGAHIVSTDFPAGEAHPDSGYIVTLPGSVPARPNPINGPANGNNHRPG